MHKMIKFGRTAIAVVVDSNGDDAAIDLLTGDLKVHIRFTRAGLVAGAEAICHMLNNDKPLTYSTEVRLDGGWLTVSAHPFTRNNPSLLYRVGKGEGMCLDIGDRHVRCSVYVSKPHLKQVADLFHELGSYKQTVEKQRSK